MGSWKALRCPSVHSPQFPSPIQVLIGLNVSRRNYHNTMPRSHALLFLLCLIDFHSYYCMPLIRVEMSPRLYVFSSPSLVRFLHVSTLESTLSLVEQDSSPGQSLAGYDQVWVQVFVARVRIRVPRSRNFLALVQGIFHSSDEMF